MPAALIAIDQGTTSTRAIAFDAALHPLATAQQELRQIFPAPGLVEHDPEEIWQAVVATVRAVMAQAHLTAKDVAGIGITNQRETTVLWDRASGKPIHNAIVWQDRRTAAFCDALKRDGHEPAIAAKTGLILDPYFSASKIAWLLDNVDGARAFGRGGPAGLRHHRLFPVVAADRRQGRTPPMPAMPRARCCWISTEAHGTKSLCRLFGVPQSLLPQVRDCAGEFGETVPELFGCADPNSRHGRRPAGGDRRAGLLQARHDEIDLRHRLFCVAQYRHRALASRNRLLTTIAYQLDGKRTYALEGAIFVAGAAVQWLRDGLKIIAKSSEVGALAARADPAEAGLSGAGFRRSGRAILGSRRRGRRSSG